MKNTNKLGNTYLNDKGNAEYKRSKLKGIWEFCQILFPCIGKSERMVQCKRSKSCWDDPLRHMGVRLEYTMCQFGICILRRWFSRWRQYMLKLFLWGQ